MDVVLSRHIGHPVVVYSTDEQGIHRDAGTLLATDSIWIVLKKADGEMLYFSVYKTRVVKIGTG